MSLRNSTTVLRATGTAPSIRLAYAGSMPAIARGLKPMPGQSDAQAPALLVSYVYLDLFLRHRHKHQYRDWVLDSGAFSAHTLGIEIKLQEYIDHCKRLMESEPKLTEIFALDVVGDWRATVKNTEEMWRQGVPAIPCYHVGSPWSVLTGLARDYPKIALGGVALTRSHNKKIEWAEQCFARVWPKKIHGFGFGSERAILAVPWHSADSSTWCNPCRFGRWQAFEGKRVSVRGSKQNLRAEVDWYLKLESKAQSRWRREMQVLERLP